MSTAPARTTTLRKDWSMGLLKLVTATVIFMGGVVPRWTTPSSTSTSATTTKVYLRTCVPR